MVSQQTILEIFLMDYQEKFEKFSLHKHEMVCFTMEKNTIIPYFTMGTLE
jgi:hypothetical protein